MSKLASDNDDFYVYAHSKNEDYAYEDVYSVTPMHVDFWKFMRLEQLAAYTMCLIQPLWRLVMVIKTFLRKVSHYGSTAYIFCFNFLFSFACFCRRGQIFACHLFNKLMRLGLSSCLLETWLSDNIKVPLLEQSLIIQKFGFKHRFCKPGNGKGNWFMTWISISFNSLCFRRPPECWNAILTLDQEPS